MLENQNYIPPPLVGVSDALFTDRLQVNGLDWQIINEFRRVIMPLSVFRFVYIHGQSDGQYKLLCDLGLHFVTHIRLVIGEPASERSFWDFSQAAELIYHPSESRYLYQPSVRTMVQSSKAAFTDALMYFVRSGAPFSKSAFFEVLNIVTTPQ